MFWEVNQDLYNFWHFSLFANQPNNKLEIFIIEWKKNLASKVKYKCYFKRASFKIIQWCFIFQSKSKLL